MPPTTAGGAPAATVVYVADGRDGTITRLDGATGRPLGAPLPAGPAPWRMAAGPGGHLLVLSTTFPVTLTHIAPAGHGDERWAARPIPLEATASGAILAGDGPGRRSSRRLGPPHGLGPVAPAGAPAPAGTSRPLGPGFPRATGPSAGVAGAGTSHPLGPVAPAGTLGPGGRAALAYAAAPAGVPPSAWPCRLVLLDVATGEVVAAHTPCEPREAIVSLALDDGPDGPVAYLGLWRRPTWDDPAAALLPARGRIRALDAATGAVLADALLAGLPEHLVLAAAPGGTGRRLYVVEGRHRGAWAPGTTEAGDPVFADHWLVRGLEPHSLEDESMVGLNDRPRALAVTSDGGHAYALAGLDGTSGSGPPGNAAARSLLLALDLRRGTVHLLGSVPGTGHGGLALAGDRLYVPDPERSVVAVVDRRHGGPLPSATAGRAPVGITVGRP